MENNSDSDDEGFQPLLSQSNSQRYSVNRLSSMDFYNSSNNNALELLFDYYLREKYRNPLPFDRGQIAVLFLQLLGATAGVYVWPPARDFAKGKSLWFGWSVIVTNPLSSVLFLMKATADFLNATIQDLSSPKEIRGVIEPPRAKTLVSKYTKIALGSAICAVPFGILTYFYPLPHCDSGWCLSLIVFHSWASNLVLHALSWGFILTPEFWYFRIPVLPIAMLFKYLHNLCISDEKRGVSRQKTELTSIYGKYKLKISTALFEAVEAHVSDHIDSQMPSQNAKKISMVDKLTEKNVSETDLSHRFVDFIEMGFQKKNALDYDFTHPYPMSLVKYLGGIFIMIGVLGWIISPFYLATQVLKLSSASAFLFGILPAYTTAVLGSFFGINIMPRLYTYFATWGGLNSKLSFEARMFPKTFGFLSILNTYIAAFAFAVGEEYLESTKFNSGFWEQVRPILVYIAIPALVILSFVPLLDLINSILRAGTAYFGAEGPTRNASRLLCSSAVFGARVKQLKGPELMESLKQYSQEDRAKLGIGKTEFEEDYQKYSDNVVVLQKRSSYIGY